MNIDDRESLIRLEEQLKESSRSHSQLLADIRDLFQRIERESKITANLSGDLKGHMENSSLRWSQLERRLVDLEHGIEAIDNKINDMDVKASTQKQETQTAFTEIQKENSNEKSEFEKAIAKENKEREKFEKEVKTSVKLIAWVFGVLASIATIISAVTMIITLKSG